MVAEVIKTISDITRNSYIDSDIVKGNTYSYNVIAVDEYGINSDKSNTVELLTNAKFIAKV